MSKIFRKTVRKQRLSRYQEQTLEAYQFHKRREGLRRFKQKREVYGKRTVVLNKKILRAFKLCKTQLLKKKNIEFFNITRKPRNTVKNARLRRKYRNKWILFHAGLAKIRKTRKLYGLNNLIRSRQPIRREIPG